MSDSQGLAKQMTDTDIGGEKKRERAPGTGAPAGGIERMKAFIAACVVVVCVSVVAAFALDSLGMSSSNVYSTDNVRLGE